MHTSGSLGLLDRAVRLTRWILGAITVMFVVFAMIVVTGHGTLSLAGSTDEVEPYRPQPGEHVTDVEGTPTHLAETSQFVSDDANVRLGTTDVDIIIDDDQTLIRLLAVAVVAGWLVLAWIAVTHLGELVRSLRAREGFIAANARHVRRLGAVVIAFQIVTICGQVGLRKLVDQLDLAGPAVAVDIGVADWWAWLLFGLLLVGIAGLFEHGTALQERDEATI